MSDAPRKLAERVVDRMMGRDAFSQWLGLEILEVRPDAVRVQMRVRDDMVNGFGVCHGGVTFALADSALAFASNTHGRVTVSIENSITYPAAVRPGDLLVAVAEQESATQRLAFFRVVVSRVGDAEGGVVALFRGTVYRTKQDHFPESTTA